MERISIEKIRIDGGTQIRETINTEAVEAYSAHLNDLPPVTLFFDGKFYWMADGFHRFFAHKERLAKSIAAEVRQGTLRDAILYAVGANRTHGLRMTNADKQKAVKMLLADPRYENDSNVKVAAMAGVSEFLVRSIRENSIISNSSSSCCTPQEPKNKPASTPTKTAPSRSLPGNTPSDPIQEVATPVQIVDSTGRVIEDPQIAADFARIGEINDILHQLSQMKSFLVHANESKDRLYRFLNLKSVLADLTNLYNAFKQARPYALCPFCGGRRTACKACHDMGWVGKLVYDIAPQELK